LQERFDEYLQERGVGEELALFIPEYAEFKEQRVRGDYLGDKLNLMAVSQEYMNWLRNVKTFVDA
jgi:complement component 1 Q subcomponent-binding protein